MSSGQLVCNIDDLNGIVGEVSAAIAHAQALGIPPAIVAGILDQSKLAIMLQVHESQKPRIVMPGQH